MTVLLVLHFLTANKNVESHTQANTHKAANLPLT